MSEPDYDIVIAGGGPAGSSLAIRLAGQGATVLLAEQKRFPRHKLCGEFISPECLDHFRELGVLDAMLSSGAESLLTTVFYARKGSSFAVPSDWLGGPGLAMGLSRARMDSVLLDEARRRGVTVLEEAAISGTINVDGRTRGVTLKSADIDQISAAITVDATGRTRALARQLERSRSIIRSRARHVAFKAHLAGAKGTAGECEIYSYSGGYGGLNSVEGGVANLCFIVDTADVRRVGNEPEELIRHVVMHNRRAAETLNGATAVTEWTSVALEHFGASDPIPGPRLISVGDAAAFIDPFTGSGMLMALESSKLAAEMIARWLNSDRSAKADHQLEREYRRGYAERFSSRLRLCSWLRRAASVPLFADSVIGALGLSSSLVQRLARATRQDQSTPVG